MDPYRKLSTDEAALMRFWLGERAPTHLAHFTNWPGDLRDEVYQACKELGCPADFEFYPRPTGKGFYILATCGHNCWAISPELQGGLTKERLRQIYDRLPQDMSWREFWRKTPGVWFFLSAAGAALVHWWTYHIGGDQNPETVEAVAVVMLVASIAFSTLALCGIFVSFSHDNPLRRRRLRAQIGMTYLRLATALTKEEEAVDAPLRSAKPAAGDNQADEAPLNLGAQPA